MSTNADVKSVLTIVSKVLRESADATKKSLDELESIEMKYRQEYEEAEKKKKELCYTRRIGRYLKDDNNWTTGPFGLNERFETEVEYKRLAALHVNTLEEYLEACRKFNQANEDLWSCRYYVRDCYRISAAIKVSFPKFMD